MPSTTANGLRDLLLRHRGLIVPTIIVASVLVIVAPLPPVLMDVLLACNITVAVIILLTTIHVSRPLDFSVFPSILLGTTLIRLVLNVASTRMILTRGAAEGTQAAGGVIEAFGRFVTGGEGEIVVGLIIFSILIVVQFLVITKGATRISEVAARFALDGMPGKQMAVDADLNARLITQQEAQLRRREITQQADFYAAMDGAGKFVRGDALAGVVITLINIAGGLYVGLIQQGMEFSRAVAVFTTLTIGDGLVTQIPAFLISLGAGLLVTRKSSSSDLSKDVVGQLFGNAQALYLAGGFLAALSLTGLPAVPLLTLAFGCGLVGFQLQRGHGVQIETGASSAPSPSKSQPKVSPAVRVSVDPLVIELGIGLLRLADRKSADSLLGRVGQLRRQIARELGLVLPEMRIRDNIQLEHNQYQFTIRDVPVAWGAAIADALLAIDTGNTTDDIPGVTTVEPAFGRPAKWIEADQRLRAEADGYRVVEPDEVIMTHLRETVREHAADLLGRQQVHQLLDGLKRTSPKLVEELTADRLKASDVHQVLKRLLRERVPIRDLERILETLGNHADQTRDITLLTEYVRAALAPAICQQHRDTRRILRVITLDPLLEDVLSAGIEFERHGLVVKLSSDVTEAVVGAVANESERLIAAGYAPVVCCGSAVRAGLKQMTASALPRLAVLSLNEITRDTEVEALSQVGIDVLPAASTAHTPEFRSA